MFPDFRLAPFQDFDGREAVVLNLHFGQTIAEDHSWNPDLVAIQ
jgi:hypothetical protein